MYRAIIFINFNPRTYVRCDEREEFGGYYLKIFQSTHLREVRHVYSWYSLIVNNISIHAPTWGATRSPSIPPAPDPVFQSTHLREVRHSLYSVYQTSECISIHAPTWGATRIWMKQIWRRSISIHAPTWGATIMIKLVKALELFQSTHLREVRPAGRMVSCLLSSFQSTHLREVRLLFRFACTDYFSISIHAPTWGATYHYFPFPFRFFSFQSTHLREVRR